MPWCPKCRSEYAAEIPRCLRCDIELVEELPPLNEPEPEKKKTRQDILNELDMPNPYEMGDNFTMEDMMRDLDGNWKKPEGSKLYKSPQMRYADLRSSASSFLMVGVLGVLVVILILTGILSLPFNNFMPAVMLCLFVGCIVCGILSMKKANEVKATIPAELAYIKKVSDWYHSEARPANAELDAVDSSLYIEERYLKRYNIIRDLLEKQFPETESSLLDKLASDFCEEEMDAEFEQAEDDSAETDN